MHLFFLFLLSVFGGCKKDPASEKIQSQYPEFGIWTRYSFENKFHPAYHTVLLDSKGNLWFSTNLGACKFDGVNWKIYSMADGLATNDVTAINEDVDGTIWFGTSNFFNHGQDGFSSFDGEHWNTINLNNGDESVFVIFRDKNSNLWFGTNNGIRKYDGNKWINYFPEIAGHRIYTITEDSNGNIYFGGEKSLFCLQVDGDWRIIDNFITENSDEQLDLILAVDDSIWIETQNSAFSYLEKYSLPDFSTSYSPDFDNSPPSNFISSMVLDNTKNLWCGTVKSYLPENLLNDPDYQKEKSTIWKFDGTRWYNYNVNYQNIVGIAVDKGGSIWFVAENELIKYTPR
jgi:ligand-binding sensor domain-containing protein